MSETLTLQDLGIDVKEGEVTAPSTATPMESNVGETLSLSDLGITEGGAVPETKAVSQYYDPDSFGAKLDVGIEGMKSGIYEGYGLLADMLGADETAKENRDAAESIRKELAARPQPTQTASIVEEAPEIVEKFSEGNILEGFNKLAGQAETLTATALPSLAPTVAAIYGTAITGKWLKYIPRVGKPAYWLYRTVGSLLPS